jgi:hypothetical protein
MSNGKTGGATSLDYTQSALGGITGAYGCVGQIVGINNQEQQMSAQFGAQNAQMLANAKQQIAQLGFNDAMDKMSEIAGCLDARTSGANRIGLAQGMESWAGASSGTAEKPFYGKPA